MAHTCPAALSVPTDRSQTLPEGLPRSLVGLFAAASGLSVANVYYSQPLLDALAGEFALSHAAVGAVIAATHMGCALALVLLVPLGDRADRRRLMFAQQLALVASLGVVAMATSASVLLVGMLAVGLLGTAMTQGLIAYAASVAAPHEQGRVVGAAQGGVLIGLLVARVLSGMVSDFAGWRGVYVGAAGITLGLAFVLRRCLPTPLQAPSALPYPRLLASMLTLLRHERILQVRGTLALLMFAVFNVFWGALTLALSAPPFGYGHTAIGAFGLAGVVGAMAAFRAGKWADLGYGERTSAMALALLVSAWWPLSVMESSLWALLIGIVVLDLAGQALHVTNQSMIFRIRPEARSRLVGVYMLFYAVGSGLGGMAATAVYARAGWWGVCVLGAGISMLALVFWVLTRPVGRQPGRPAGPAAS